jgi:transketolase
MAELHLVDLTNSGAVEFEPIRKGFGRGLKKAGEQNESIVALCADLTDSTQISLFAEAFPERYIEVGIAEQNLAVLGAGLAAMGKIPFISSYAAFSPGRNWEQIKTSIALNNRPVKIVGSHAGLYTGPDGATHQMLEDIGLMRTMPNMVVLVPGDSVEAEKATLAMVASDKPNYLRLARDKSPIITTAKTPFEIGKAYVYESGSDVTFVATGVMTYHALMAAEMLYKDGIDAEVVHVPTIKPIDEQTILKSVKKTKHVITLEEAQINGGLGSAVAELLGENFPTPMKRMGMKDRYGESGQPDELLEHFGLTAKHIALQAHAILDCKDHKH